MNGDSTFNSIGHYGTQGIFDSLNSPPALYESCEWTDLQGNFWLFGGVDFNLNDHSDLWEFNPNTNQWAWIKGPGIPNQPGIYGTQNISSPNNNPGARGWGIPTWVDSTGNLWLFGGKGYDITGINNASLNDLWMFNISSKEWTWFKGSSIAGSPGSYGTIGLESSTNNPPSREETNISWTDNGNKLWLFGGYAGSRGAYSDLWKFNINTNNWTWVNGPDSTNQLPVYGTLGVPDSSNIPCSRYAFAKWKDCNNNLWFFAGSDDTGNVYNDLWQYKIITNQWAWIGGTNIENDTGTDNNTCLSSINNIPLARYENRACWIRGNGNFEFFGGYSRDSGGTNYNDLWDYNVMTKEWTLMSGTTLPNQAGYYGIKTISSSLNLPPSRGGAISWKDTAGNLWLFGGSKFAGNRFNDLWRFVPDTTCPALIPCNSTEAINTTIPSSNQIFIYPNPASTCITFSISVIPTKEESLLITDVLGNRLILQQINSTHAIINISQLSNGIYFWRMISNNMIIDTGKIVVIK